MSTVDENREQWLAALRSGDYRQGTGALYDWLGYCCLGVAQDLYLKAHPYKPGWNHPGGPRYAHSYPKDEVKDWLGLSEDDLERAATMNDHEHRWFTDIAGELEYRFAHGYFRPEHDEQED